MTDRGELIQVDIFGERYTLRGLRGEDPVYAQRLAQYVDGQIHEVAGGTPVLSVKVAVLASLNIADALFQLEEKVQREEMAAAAKIEELRAALDEAMQKRPSMGGSQG